MSRAAAFAFFCAVSSLGGQVPVSAPETVPGLPALPPPPSVPGGESGTVLPVAPPLPGQLEAEPVVAPVPVPVAPAPAVMMPAAAPAPTVPPPVGGAPPVPGTGQVSPPVPDPLAGLPPVGGRGLATLPLGAPPPMSLAVPPKLKVGASTSTSGQFIVHGDDLTLRSMLSTKCEAISSELRKLLHDRENWTVPIVVLMNSGEKARKADKAATTVISQLTHGGFHLQVNVNMRPDLSPDDLRGELIRALLAERILRNQKEITAKRKLLLPDWLYLGILEATEYRRRARPSALFAAIFKSGKIFGIEEIIEASASDIEDSLSRTIYQTSCCALVLALLDQPESGLRMGKFLNALASDPRSERELLNQWFPAFASSEASLNKWWALQLATLASPGMAEPLTVPDTLAALEDALTLRFEAKPADLPRTSRRVATPVKASSPAAGPAVAAQRQPGEETSAPVPETGDETGEEEAKKPGFMSRLIPFGRGKTEDEELAAAIKEAARAEAAATAAPKKVPAPEKTAEKPAAPETTGDDQPSGLNPLNWFRGGKKAKEEQAPAPEKDEAPKTKKGNAAWQPEEDFFATQLLAGEPVTAWVMQEVAAEAPAEADAEKRRFFGLFGKKKPEDDPAEPEAPKTPPAPAPATAKKETAPPAAPPAEAKEETSRRQPLRLRLFGDKKEDETAPDAAAEEAPMPAAAAEAPAPAPARPQPKPAAKAAPSKDEAAVAATLPIEDYAAILKRKDLAKILERNINILSALQNRGAVLFRPIATEYLKAMEDILKGRTKGLDARLRELRARMEQARTQSNAVRDLLDVHEANESPAMSGLFEDYLKLPETIEKELPERTDPISKYLDALDREFTKE